GMLTVTEAWGSPWPSCTTSTAVATATFGLLPRFKRMAAAVAAASAACCKLRYSLIMSPPSITSPTTPNRVGSRRASKTSTLPDRGRGKAAFRRRADEYRDCCELVQRCIVGFLIDNLVDNTHGGLRT